MGSKADMNFTFDSDLELKDAGLVAASAAATVNGSAQILDLGDALMQGMVVIEVSAIEIASNDEAYTIVAQFSSDADFGTAGNIHDMCQMHLGAKETKLSDCDKDDEAGRYLLPVQNWEDGTYYRYMRLYTVVAGTIASGINYRAFLSKGSLQ